MLVQDRQDEHALAPGDIEHDVWEAAQQGSPCLSIDEGVADWLLGDA
jgi:hypothetical protein